MAKLPILIINNAILFPNMEFRSETVNTYEQDIINKIDKSKLKVKNDDELKTVIKMLYLVTRKALVSTFKGEELNKVRDEYIKMIEYLKHGILK